MSIIHHGKRIKKKKTSAKHNTLDPTWNEALVFNCAKDLLDEIELEVLITNDILLGHSTEFGKAVLGSNVSGKDERIHWQDMIYGKNNAVRWHRLIYPD